MPKIVDLPDDPKFTIKNVATQTGIRPVTLRAWERRHEALNPHRSDNRYRLYSERDVAILRWLKSRVDEGFAISSAVSELRTMATKNMWPEAVEQAPERKTIRTSKSPQRYSSQLYQALTQHNEVRAGELLQEVHAVFDVMTVFTGVLIPVLREIGEAWYRGEIRITTEHFASAYLRGKLLSLLQAYPFRRSAPLVLVGCAPEEQHELGALMMAVLLRSEGYRVEYLGPDIPVEDLVDYASYQQPALIVLSAVAEYSAQQLRRMNEMLKKKRSDAIFAYGGRAFDLQPRLVEETPGVYLGKSLDSALETVKSLI